MAKLLDNHAISMGFINLILGAVNLGIYNSDIGASTSFAVVGVFGVLVGAFCIYKGLSRPSIH